MLYILNALRRFVFFGLAFVACPSSVWNRYRGAVALWRSRRALVELSDNQFVDVGLTRDQADAESQRPFFADKPPWVVSDCDVADDSKLESSGQSLYRVRRHDFMG